MAKAKTKTLYDVHPGVAMVQKWIAELKEKTGRSLEEWVDFVKTAGPKDEKSQREWLKVQQKLGTNSAWWIAARVSAALRPIYDELLKLAKSVGSDVKACPGLTMVPLYRNHVFAQIKPTTNTRVDFGLALARHKGKLPKHLVDTGGLAKKDRITHRIEITDVSQIDADVKKWLKTAYDLDK